MKHETIILGFKIFVVKGGMDFPNALRFAKLPAVAVVRLAF